MASPGVTLGGTIRDIAGNPVAGTVQIVLSNLGGWSPTIAGDSELAPLQVTATANGSGVWTVTLWGNYQISPANTFYTVTIYPAGSNAGSWTSQFAFPSGGSFNLSNLTPVNAPILPPSQFLQPPVTLAANNTWTGTNTFDGAVNLGDGGSLAGTYSGSPTLSGNLTIEGNLIGGGSYVELAPSQVLQWNADIGISRSALGVLAVGNSNPGDHTGTVDCGAIIARTQATVGTYSVAGGFTIQSTTYAGPLTTKGLYIVGSGYDATTYYDGQLGFSAWWNGTDYKTGTDTGSNGGVILAGTGDGSVFNIYSIPSTGGTQQTISAAAMAANLIVSVNPGGITVTGSLVESTSHTPSSSTDTGTKGQLAWDGSYFYVCTATNTWSRVAITHSGW